MKQRGVAIEWGPPGVKGVGAIMGVGSTDSDRGPPHATDAHAQLVSNLRQAGVYSVGLCVVGLFIGSTTLRNIGAGGALVAFGVRYLPRPVLL